MILKLTTDNLIDGSKVDYFVSRPAVDYNFYSTIKDVRNDDDAVNVINDLFHTIDCTREYDCGRPMMTTYFMYKYNIQTIYYYMLKISNQFIYNNILDKLIQIHNNNQRFEYEYPYEVKPVKKKAKRKNKNKFNKLVTHDLFTNEETYIYDNPKTGEYIMSNNAELLDKLNNKNKPKKKSHSTSVSLDAMTFSFDNKRNNGK